jgi:hypothetical protein
MVMQILEGAISASWVLAGCGTIIGFFMIRTLIKIYNNIDKHEKQINNITIIQIKMLTKMGIDDDYYEKLARELNNDK